MRKNLERQPNLNVYNAYKAGLFGHHHSDRDAGEMVGVDMKYYHALQEGFAMFCSVIGGRVLYAMDEGSALITPWPIDRKLVEHMAQVWGIDTDNVTMLSLEDKADVRDLPAEILARNAEMDALRAWVDKQTLLPVLSPRTTTPETVIMARELGISHLPKLPAYPSQLNGKQAFGLYPTLEYIENHPAEENNSKAANFLLLKQLDGVMGTDFSPKGDVAGSIEEIIAIADGLFSQGCEVMIKADLAVDGQGNLKIEKCEGRQFQELSYGEKRKYITDLLIGKYTKEGEDRKMVLLGKGAPVVVCEFLSTKIYDPSVEIYSPPKEWGVKPQIYYDCGMIIKGGFQGSIVGDPVDAADIADIPMLEMHNIPGILVERKSEYRRLMARAKEMVMAFSKVKWGEGYVGISDCDLAICLGKDGKLSVKILEFNFNRETGGTAPYHISQRLSQGLSKPGYVVARDAVGAGRWSDFAEIQRWTEDVDLDYLKRREGLLVLGARPDGGMMSLVFSPTLKGALHWDLLLKELTS